MGDKYEVSCAILAPGVGYPIEEEKYEERCTIFTPGVGRTIVESGWIIWIIFFFSLN